MKKNFLKVVLTLVLCCTCALLVAGCEENNDWQTLTISGEPSTCSVYERKDNETFQDWSNNVFSSVTFTYTNTRNDAESFTCTGLKEFRAKGGILSFNPNSVGEHTAKFSYNGVKVEITITVA